MKLPAGTRLGSYEVLAPLGAGGMGEVYRARDVRLGREVAIKVLPEEVASDARRLARFEQEARSASALNHPNIITIHEVGESDGTAYIAMELVDGGTVRELVAAGPLPVRKVLALGAQAAEGLAKAHAAGIVHRDLKPENLMVSRDGFVKILDFGLAKLTEPEPGELSAAATQAAGHPETQPGTVLGTVGYMSPEQASGRPLDFRSDQFSLGSILYEMASGEKAFARKTAAETMSAIIREEPEPLSRRRPETPIPLRWIVERCLAKDPEERYASSRDLARDLAGVRDHISEVSSGAETLLAAPGRPRGRLPLLLGLAALAAGLLAGWAIAQSSSGKTSSAPSFQRLTFRHGQIGNARFAPDGQSILYGAIWEGELRRMRLYQANPQSPESREFEVPDADILAVSPAGELAILVNVAGPWGILARLPVAGGVPRQVLEGVLYASADWARDGKDLAVVHRLKGKTRLEYPIGQVLLESEGLSSPRFSPSGDEIAFFDGTSIAVVDAQGKGKKILSSGWRSVAGAPVWRPDAREIWFTASESARAEALWAVDRAGKRRLVTRVPGSLELDDISRDGRVLAAHHLRLQSIRGLAPGETEERELSWLDASFPADLSSDGKLLLLLEVGEGSGARTKIYLRGTDGSPAVRLGEGNAHALSPDGQWVLAASPEGDPTPTLSLLPTGPGEAKKLPNPGFESVGGGGFLPDSKEIVFTARARGRPAGVWRQQIPGGTPRPVAPESAGTLPPRTAHPVSPDGRFVILRNNQGTFLYPLVGGEARSVPLGEDEFPVQWTADSHSLYVHSPSDRSVQLLDLETGQKRLWRDLRREGFSGPSRIRITPDGKSYVYSYSRTFSELYLIEGLK